MTASIEAQIAELTGVSTNTTSTPISSVLCCEGCGETYPMVGDAIPATCPACLKDVRQWPGHTVEEAKRRAKRSEPKPHAPKKAKTTEPVRAGPVPEAKAPVVEAHDPLAAAIARRTEFTKAHGLTDQFGTPVGTATVQAIGFQTWDEGKSSFHFPSPFDTPESFRAEYRECAKKGPDTRTDALLLGNLGTSLTPVARAGEIAAYSNLGSGPDRSIKAGDRVTVYAKVNARGFITFGCSKLETEKTK